MPNQNKSGMKTLLIVVVVIIALVAIYFAVQSAPNSPGTGSQTSTQTIGVSTTTTSTTSGTPPAKATSSPQQPPSVTWVPYSNSHYGISFSYPSSDKFVSGGILYSPGGSIGPLNYVSTSTNFQNANGAIVLGGAESPKTDYPGTPVIGTLFAVSVNPNVTSSAACALFGNYGIPHTSYPLTVKNISYNRVFFSLGSDGISGGYYDMLHTYQNGLCYELTLGSEQTDAGSFASQWNETSTLESFLSHVSFSAPTQ